jgi:peptidyl-prolyl cis-trans isomerase B (cyclophilin B)
MKKGVIIGGILLLALLIVAIIIPQKDVDNENMLNINYDVKGNETKLKYDTENPVVAMYIEDYGSIVMELYPDIAPNTVNNFISLVKSGYYDNNTMHRLVSGFVLQGGDPTGLGSGGPDYSINGEFTNNGFENNLSHEKWVVSMARSSNPNSAGSQFFICIDDATQLDGNYAAFGKVIDGFDNIESIVENEIVQDTDSGKLLHNLTIKKTLIDLKGKEYPEVEKVTE